MRGYILVDVNIKNLELFKEYASRIPALIEKHAGRYIVKGVVPKVIRGSNEIPQYSVVIEFPSVEAADNFIEERANTDLIAIFDQSTEGRILRVEGCI